MKNNSLKNNNNLKNNMKNSVAAVLVSALVAGTAFQPLTVLAEPTAAVKTETAAEAEKTETAVETAKAEAEKALAEAEAKKEAAFQAEKEARRAKAEAKAAEKAVKEAQEKVKEEEIHETRQEIVDFAVQFEGNPYVYGGTSLTNGADCSGFVMSVFNEFGYELPRVAAAQLDSAEVKDVNDIEAGDLVFYGDYGIDHVALYIGDEKIIHASTSATGIKISDYNYREPAAIGNYIK